MHVQYTAMRKSNHLRDIKLDDFIKWPVEARKSFLARYFPAAPSFVWDSLINA